MSSKAIAIIGAGGFGRETADVIAAINAVAELDPWELKGVYDDAPSEANLIRLEDRGIAYLGPITGARGDASMSYVIGVGNPKVREMLAERMSVLDWDPAVLIHPDAVIGTRSRIGGGTVVCGGVQVSTNVTLGRHVHLNPNSTIGHDAELRDFVSVNPAAVVSGEVVVGRGSLLGANATVLQGLRVGESSTVGAAACAVRDVSAGATVIGVPAKER